jgi:hypothetical protein
MRRVHCTNCGQTFLTDTTDRCPLCRKVGSLVDPESPAAVREEVSRKREQAENTLAVGPGVEQAVGVASLAWWFGRVFLTAVLLIGLGVWLIVDPNVRGPRFTLAAAWPGLTVLAAGLGLLGLAVYLVIRLVRAQARASPEREPPAQPPENERSGPPRSE